MEAFVEGTFMEAFVEAFVEAPLEVTPAENFIYSISSMEASITAFMEAMEVSKEAFIKNSTASIASMEASIASISSMEASMKAVKSSTEAFVSFHAKCK